VVELIGGDLGDGGDDRVRLEHVAADQGDAVAQVRRGPQPRLGTAANQADDLTAIVEQLLGEEGSVLAGEAGDERARARWAHAGPRPDRT
jgi:hypothetical protein